MPDMHRQDPAPSADIDTPPDDAGPDAFDAAMAGAEASDPDRPLHTVGDAPGADTSGDDAPADGEPDRFAQQDARTGDDAHTLREAYEDLVRFVEGLIPDEPDPALAESDPGAYRHRMALRDGAIADLQAILAGRERADAPVRDREEEDLARLRADEEARLVAAMPALGDPGRRAAFDAANMQTALDFGFSADEIGQTVDHRVLRLVHYARIGRIAERNRRNARRRAAETPRQDGPSPASAGPFARNRAAMKRLSETGSFEDALAVDFE